MSDERASELDFQEIFARNPISALVVNESHHIVAVSQSFEVDMCASFVDARGGYCPLIVHSLDAPHPSCPLDEAATTGEAAADELYDAKHDRWLESCVIPLQQVASDGQRLFLHTIVDITDRKHAEESAEARREELESLVAKRTAALDAANAAKDEFLALMSHELRTPLNSIIGFSGALLQELAGPLTEEQERQLRMVERAGRHLLHLVNDLLFADSVVSGEVRLSIEAVDVCEVASLVTAEIAPIAREKGIELDFLSDSELVVATDPSRLRQVLYNLVANAVKFTDAGSVAVSCSAEEDTLVVEVRDTGRGICDSELERIFERYYKIGADQDPSTPGAGLGLPVSRAIAEALGGSLNCESGPGVGSVFSLRLPLRNPVG